MATRTVQGAGQPRLPGAFGKYTLLHRIAKGGMAELYLALHRSTAGFEKLVVIKRALPYFNQEEDFIQMLLHEARIAATLSHPNIVQIYDVGQADGTYYIAMEHVHGEDLRSIQRQLEKNRRDFPIEHALSVVIGLCSGLSYAHEKCDLAGNHLRIVHRDISPHNVLVSFSGDVKLVDFGVAKSRVQLADQTRAGSIKGKIAYMSPEQAVGHGIDARSDVFAIGTTLYEVTTGRRLFRGRTDFETLRMVGAAKIVPPREVKPDYPRGLEEVVMKALAKYPQDRYQSARDLQFDLERFVHAAHLYTSALFLSAFMHDLFAEKLRDQDQILAKVKKLADSNLVDPPRAFEPELPSLLVTSTPATASVTDVADLKPRAAVGWLPWAAAAAAVAFAIGSSAHRWQQVGVSKGRWFHFEDIEQRARDYKDGRPVAADEAAGALTGKLTVSATGAGCPVLIDGKPAGQAPFVDFVLPVGSHAVECAPSSGRAFSVIVRVEPGETAHVGFVLP